MFQVHYLNPVSTKGTALWTENYQTAESVDSADAIVVRSAAMHEMSFSDNLLAVARAGAGVNNIPLDRCAEEGIVVFNTPGANANGVVELALCGMLLGCRDVIGGINWVQSIKDEGDVGKKVEKGKSKFAGFELAGKKLGVIGLGAIGGPLANAAIKLGMEVYGCDPFISINAAWHLDSNIIPVKTREEIYSQCDIITVHVPLMDTTKKMINAEALSQMKDGVVLLNFARDLLVDDDALEEALKSGKVKRYITDFPNDKTAGMAGVVAIPHLGASTEESEDNCAMMAADELIAYIEKGEIKNSVNLPNMLLGDVEGARTCIIHKDDESVLAAIKAILGDVKTAAKKGYAYTVADVDADAAALQAIDGVKRVRIIK